MKDDEKPPLRIVLRNFLNHIENLESQISPEKSYDIEFQALKLFSENVKGLKEYSCLEGEKEVNRKKNRYKDILPFDVSRVVLQEYNGIPGSDYINANFIKGASGSPAYIASQGPLPCSVNDFWRMVVQCEVHVIVMACNQEEAGKAKCEKYWVDEGEERHFGRISVRLLKSSTVCPDFSVRTMRLKYSNNSSMVAERTVCQVHYVAWPDHGVPSVVHPLLDMVRLVRDTQASETLPVLVHCSAGCGRTGTICAIDYVFGLLRTGKLTSDFSLSALIRDMRRQRIAMVQTKEQYVLVHQAVRELFREQLSVIDSHPYENVDPDGSLIIKNDQGNIYDTIECPEEKGDFKMEKDAQVCLYPKKKPVTLYSSKQEKEVENLTEQLRSVQAGSNPRPLIDISSNDISPSLSSNSQHSTSRLLYKQDFIGKKENSNVTKPIPSKGILRVPLLPNSSTGGSSQQTTVSTNIVPVKRSKSLKIMSVHRDRSLGARLTIPSSSSSSVDSQLRSPQIHHHPQQTLLLSQHTSAHTGGTTTETGISINEANPVRDEASILSKYNGINMNGKKPLVRSYTTLDMRHKITMALAERRLQQAISGEIKPGINSPKTPPEKGFDRSYGGSSNITNRRGNSRSYVFRNICPPPPQQATASSQPPPARTYMVRERGSKNLLSQKSLHSSTSASGVAEYYAIPSSQQQTTVRQYHQHSDTYQQQQQHQQQHYQPINHHRTYLQSGHSNPQGHYIEKAKIKRPSRSIPGPSSKDIGEVSKYDTATDYSDKYRCLGNNDIPAQHPYDHHRPPPLPQQGPSVFGPSPLYPPLPPRNQHPLVPHPLAPRDTQLQSTHFAMAPGVDIDQVAASIPHKDESKSNLMKVALEPFQARKGKQQQTSRPTPQKHTTKGPILNYTACKKKQQQYL